MSLSISLAEPCVFLKGRTQRSESDLAFARGTLTLKVTKPTNINSIEVTLEGKTKAEWVEGLGGRRVYVSEDRIISSQKSVVYPTPSGTSSSVQAPQVPSSSSSPIVPPPDYSNTGAADIVEGSTSATTPPTSPNPGSTIPSSPGAKSRKSRFSLSAVLGARKPESGTVATNEPDAIKANFLPGTYTYPFSIPIPHDAPSTAKCDSGYVSYSIKACAHRPGAFTLNLSTSTDVMVVVCPDPDEHNLIVEKQWENSLIYRFAIMGKTFLAGSEVALDITLLPLAPIKVYLILVIFEEIVTYSAKSSSHTNHDAQRLFHVINLRGSVNDNQPLLPVVNNTVGAVTSAPLYDYVASNEREGDLAAIEQHLTRAHGPWHLTFNMKIPVKLQASHDYADSNVKIAHRIRLALRVSTGDADKKLGDRGVFDITTQFPCRVVSELCKSEWSSLQLPTYHRNVDAGETLLEGMPLEELYRARSNQSQLVAPPRPPPYVEFSTEEVSLT